MGDWYERYKNRVQLNGVTLQERIINQKKNEFDTYLRNTPNRFEVNIDDSENKYLIAIQDVNLNNKYGDVKYVVTHNETPMKLGSVFECLNNTWLTIEQEYNVMQDHQTFKIRPCTHLINFLNSKNDISSTYCILEDATKYSDGIYDNQKIKIGDTRQQITFPRNKTTEDIYIGKRILVDKLHAYVVSDIKPSSPEGLIVVIITEVPIHYGVDNLNLLIADYYENTHDYKIDVVKNLILSINDTYKLKVDVYDKQVKINNPNIIFNVDEDEPIISFENNTIKGMVEGKTQITVQFKNIIETINIQVIKDEIDNYTCEIVGEDEMLLDYTEDYTAKFYNNGVETNDVAIWTITDEKGNDTEYAKIIKVTDNTCVVKTTSNYIFDDKTKYFYLCLKGTTGKKTIKKIKITSY